VKAELTLLSMLLKLIWQDTASLAHLKKNPTPTICHLPSWKSSNKIRFKKLPYYELPAMVKNMLQKTMDKVQTNTKTCWL